MGFDKKKEVKNLFKGAKKSFFDELAYLRTPFVFICAMADDGKETEYFKNVFTPGAMNVTLSQDYIREVLNLFNGFETVYCKPRELAKRQAMEALHDAMPDANDAYDEQKINEILGEDALEPLLEDSESDAVESNIRQMLQDAMIQDEEEREGLPLTPSHTLPGCLQGTIKNQEYQAGMTPGLTGGAGLKAFDQRTTTNFEATRFSWTGSVPDVEPKPQVEDQRLYKDIELLCKSIKKGDDSFGRVIEEKKRREQEQKQKKTE